MMLLKLSLMDVPNIFSSHIVEFLLKSATDTDIFVPKSIYKWYVPIEHLNISMNVQEIVDHRKEHENGYKNLDWFDIDYLTPIDMSI